MYPSMFDSPQGYAILGTLFTWGMTAAGSSLVFFINATERKFLDFSLGFAGGVMLAASYWSLLDPAIEMAESSGLYGAEGQYAFIPVAIGFAFGALFVHVSDEIMQYFNVTSSSVISAVAIGKAEHSEHKKDHQLSHHTVEDGYKSDYLTANENLHRRNVRRKQGDDDVNENPSSLEENIDKSAEEKWKRIILLVLVITVHNIPEGLAVGVGFGAVGKSAKATFENARNLAIGIGLQNFPEGLAVSLPLRASGVSMFRSFWYGQLSGMVEPITGLIGAIGVTWIVPLLPYAMAFAAGAMIFVVFDDLIPEASTSGNVRLATWGATVGFILMMCLDVGLG